MIFLQIMEFKKEILNKSFRSKRLFNSRDILGRVKIWLGMSLLLSAGCASTMESRKVAQAQSSSQISWVEIGPSGQLSVRTLTSAEFRCPDLSVSQKMMAMSPRAPISADFPALVCETKVPNDAINLKIKDQILPALKKIAVQNCPDGRYGLPGGRKKR